MVYCFWLLKSKFIFRATAALRIRFEIPKEFRNHLDILPRTAYVQAESQFSAQLKFLPRKTLTNDASLFFKEVDGLVEIPITIIVADQVCKYTMFIYILNNEKRKYLNTFKVFN